MSVESDELRHDLEGQRALEEYQARPPATWWNVERVLNERSEADVTDLVWDSIGEEGVPLDACLGIFYGAEHRRIGKLILATILDGDEAELGRILMSQARPYIVRSCKNEIAWQGQVKSDLDDLLRDLA